VLTGFWGNPRAPRRVGNVHYRDGRDAMFAQTSGITERVTFSSKLFVDTWARWAGSVSPIYLYILENLQIQVAPGATFKTCHLQLVPSSLDSVTSNHIFEEKKRQKKKKNEELCWMVEENGWSWRSWRSRTGQQAHILEKFRKKYVGRVGIWIHDDVRHNSIHGIWKYWCPPYELGMEFAVVVEGNGSTNDKSIWEGQISARVVDATEILLSLTTVKNVMVSMNEDWCHWSR
jgi:hypothetical protein